MLKIIVTIICLIPFILGLLSILGLFLNYFSDNEKESTIEIRIEDNKNRD